MNALTPLAAFQTADNTAAHAFTFHSDRAPSTKRGHEKNMGRFNVFCDDLGVCALPASPATLAAFIMAKMHSFAPGYIRNHCATVSVAHRASGFATPLGTPEVGEAWRAVYELRDRRQKQASPINEDLRNKMVALPGDGLADLRDRALVAVAYDTLGRRFELAKLRVEDIAQAAPGAAGSILFRKTKTDQQGNGSVRFLAASTIALVRAWLEAAGIRWGVIFRSINHSKIGAKISGDAVSDIFKKRAKQAGSELADHIGGHSCRIGAAQDMASAFISDGAIMQAGGWKSHQRMFQYIERVRAGQNGAAQLAARQNRQHGDKPKPVVSIVVNGEVDQAFMAQVFAALAPIANVGAFSFAPAA